MRIFCTHCKPEYEMKYEDGKLMTHCPCTNCAVEWSIDFSDRGKPPTPARVNSYDSRGYRIER